MKPPSLRPAIGALILATGIFIFVYSLERETKYDQDRNLSRNIAIGGSILAFIGFIILIIK